MTTWISVPFAVAGLFGAPQRLLYAALAYAALFVVVIVQGRKLRQFEQGREMADKIAALIESGLTVANKFRMGDPALYPPQPEIEEWVDSAEPTIQEMGSPFVARFNNAQPISGLAIVDAPGQPSRDYFWIMSRLRVLEEIMKEIMVNLK